MVLNKPLRERRPDYLAAILRGETINQMAKAEGASHNVIYQRLYHLGLIQDYWERQDKSWPHKYPGLEDLVDQGLSLRRIGQHYGVTKQAIHFALDREHLHQRHRLARQHVRALKEDARREEGRRRHELRRIASSIEDLLWQKATLPEEKDALIAYRASRSASKLPFSTYLSLFTKYHTAQRQGTRLSLAQLGDAANVSSMCARHLLSLAGKSSMHWQSHTLTHHQKTLLTRALQHPSKLPYNDIARLLNITPSSVSIRAHGLPSRPHHLIHKPRCNATYTRAHDLYEAIDAGFTKEDALTYAGITTPHAYDKLLTIRPTVEETLRRFKNDLGLDNQAKT